MVKNAHRLPEFHMRPLKGCPDGTASTAWHYADLLCNLYRDTDPKRCHQSQTSCAQLWLKPFYTWCNMLLTGLHHSSVVSIPLLLPSNSSILPLHIPTLLPTLTCARVGGNRNNYNNQLRKNENTCNTCKSSII